MEGRSDVNMDKLDEILLPGFRFHPTDEEPVSFYLKRSSKSLSPLSSSGNLTSKSLIHRICQLASTGETEWYFYYPSERKYRNNAKPNTVTAAGFWKAAGTDRPIYSSEGTRCVGLKKSLVFYKGRATRGMKTDWMVRELRLPSLADPSLPKRPIDKNIIPLNDSLTICRIFKKTCSNAQRPLFPMRGETEQVLFSGMQSLQDSCHAMVTTDAMGWLELGADGRCRYPGRACASKTAHGGDE